MAFFEATGGVFAQGGSGKVQDPPHVRRSLKSLESCLAQSWRRTFPRKVLSTLIVDLRETWAIMCFIDILD